MYSRHSHALRWKHRIGPSLCRKNISPAVPEQMCDPNYYIIIAMPIPSYEIRVCTSCGLRYPFSAGHAFGTRCPICMGDTRLVLRRELSSEPTRSRPTAFDSTNSRKAVLLDNIRSAWNVGSIFRSAEGFGFRQIYVCGISPTPENEAVTKTSLGAEDSIPWSYHKDAVKLVKGLKHEGWRILALEEDKQARSIETEPTLENTVLIVGNEITGVDPELLDLCHSIVEIPMRGEKRSFNVAVAFAVAAYAMNR
jgi:23S rRNA (guanosine2251-2'-O)-methyltransferase